MRFHEMKKKHQKAQKPESNSAEQEAAATLEVSEEAMKAQAESAENEASKAAEEESTKDHATVDAAESEEVQTSEKNQDAGSDLAQEVQNLKDQLVRVMADNQNIRRRSESDRFRFFEDAKIRYIGMFLPVFDDLSRSLAASEQFDVPDGFMDGLKLVNKKFEDIFEKEQVERIDQTGVPFDVELHEALMRQAAPDDKTPSDTVIQVFEPGYKIGGKVVKHAKVIVSE